MITIDTHRQAGRLRARDLRELCIAEQPIVIVGAKVVGRLDLVGVHLRHSIRFIDCRFEDLMDLSDARADEPIEWRGGSLVGLLADRFESKADVIFAGVTTTGAVSLRWAHVQGDLRFSESTLSVRQGLALDGRDLRVGGSMFLDGRSFRAEGEVRLSSAHIKESLDCRHATFVNPHGKALNAFDLTVDGDVMCEDGFIARGEVCLERASLSRLQLGAGTFRNRTGIALHADALCATTGVFLDDGFESTGGVRLVGASISGQLCCTGGRFDHRSDIALDARRLKAEDVYLDHGFSAVGQVRFDGAFLTRQLNCSGGTFNNEDGTEFALDCDDLRCDGYVFLDRGFSAKGEVRLVGVQVSQELNCTGGHFVNQGGTALNADGLTTPGSVFLDAVPGADFQAIGEVRLARATIGRQLVASGALLTTNANALSLDLSGVVCPGDVLLNKEFQSTGEVRLDGADIRRDLDLTQARLSGDPVALNAKGLGVGGSMKWDPTTTPNGTVDLSGAAINKLDGSLAHWPKNNYVLAGFTCQSPPIEDSDKVGILISWLQDAKAHYSDAYQQMVAACRAKGCDDAARDLAVARQRDERKRGNLSRAGRWWNWLLDVSSGYGNKLHRPLLALAGMAVLGSLIFWWADAQDWMQPVNESQKLPYFQPVVYSIQLLIPVVDLRETTVWLPTDDTPGQWLMVYVWVSILIGWVLSSALVAGIGRLWRQGDR